MAATTRLTTTTPATSSQKNPLPGFGERDSAAGLLVWSGTAFFLYGKRVCFCNTCCWCNLIVDFVRLYSAPIVLSSTGSCRLDKVLRTAQRGFAGVSQKLHFNAKAFSALLRGLCASALKMALRLPRPGLTTGQESAEQAAGIFPAAQYIVQFVGVAQRHFQAALCRQRAGEEQLIAGLEQAVVAGQQNVVVTAFKQQGRNRQALLAVDGIDQQVAEADGRVVHQRLPGGWGLGGIQPVVPEHGRQALAVGAQAGHQLPAGGFVD